MSLFMIPLNQIKIDLSTSTSLSFPSPHRGEGAGEGSIKRCHGEEPCGIDSHFPSEQINNKTSIIRKKRPTSYIPQGDTAIS